MAKILILVAVFAAVVTGYMFITYEEPKTPETLIMGEATLPVVNFVVNKRDVNYTYGYTMEMNTSFMRDSLTIIGEDNVVDFKINRYENTIISIKYEVRSIDGSRLIEDNEIKEWNREDDLIDVSVKLSSLIQSETEYILIIKLATENSATINYYTRLLKLGSSDLLVHMEFVEFFSEATLNDDTAQEINKYREYDSSLPQNNLGYVDIYCTQDQLAWGNLKVERVTEPMMTIKEMYSVFGEYTMSYVVRATNDYDTYQYYNVTEYFRLRQGNTEMYVYSYERLVNQIFDANSQNISATRVNLGIDSDLQVEHLTSDNGSYVCFVKEGVLWCMNLKSNKAVSIFTFTSDNYANIRDNYKNHGIDIISVDSSGNVTFLVYGYMNKGEHEGKNGVSVYRYNASDNRVDELLFVQSDKAYSILKETAGRLAYLNEDNIVYIMLEDSIYTINLESNESMQLAKGLNEGNSCINEKNTIIAWHENGEENAAESIRIVNIVTGDDYVLTAGSNEYIKSLGFIGDDFIYGVAKRDDIIIDGAGYLTFPMYKMIIKIDSEKSSEEVYQKENIYVTHIEISNNMIMLERMTKAEGVFVETTEDRYINGNYTQSVLAEISTIVTDLKKTELILEFAYTITSDNKLKVSYPKEVVFGGVEGLSLRGSAAEAGKYYVYARGRMYGRYNYAYEAIDVANNMYGIVIDHTGGFAWGRILRANVVSLGDIVLKGSEGDSNLIAAVKTMLYAAGEDISEITADMSVAECMALTKDVKGIDFSGGDVQRSVYYIANGYPVVTKIDEEFVLLVGYKGTTTSIDSFTILNVNTGKTKEMTSENIDKVIKAADSIFYTVY